MIQDPNTENMCQEELDRWADLNNPNNDFDWDDWSDVYKSNNDSYLGG